MKLARHPTTAGFVTLATLCASAGGCGTRVVELVPQERTVPSGPTRRPQDAGFADAVRPDAAILDTGRLMDAGRADAAPSDSGASDSGAPDAASTCVCRYVRCQSSADCTPRVGASSVCERGACSGGTTACATLRDCAADPAGWICAENITSLNACP